MNSEILFWGVIGFLLVTMAIGLWAATRIKGDSDNYLVAGRGLALPLAAATLMAQSVDSNATLGNTDLAGQFGFWAGAALPLGLSLCLLLTGLFFAKPMNRLKLVTLPDFYRVKYGRTTEAVAAFVMVISFGFLLAGNLVAGGYLFEGFLGVSYTWGVVLIAAFVLIYTASGGLFAVAYTDALQVGIALVGTLLLTGYVALEFGFTIPEGRGPMALDQLYSPASGAYVNWATLLALGLGDIVAIDFMARIFAAKTPQVAQRACFIGSAGTALIGIPFSMIALSAPAIFAQAGVTVEGPLLFGLLKHVVPAGIGIMVLAAILSASLSTADGAILGTSSVIAHNIVGIRGDAGGVSATRLLRLTRIMAVAVTGLGVFFALRIPQTGTLLVLAFDIGFAALLIPLVGGLFWKGATAAGALSCIFMGATVRLVLFAACPTIYGSPNTLLHIENNLFTESFDGLPTFISPVLGLATYVGVSLWARGPAAGARASAAKAAV